MTRIAFIPFMILIINTANAEVFQCKAKDTLTAIEMNCGDILLFTLDNRDTRRLEIIDTEARVLLTNLEGYQKRPSWGWNRLSIYMQCFDRWTANDHVAIRSHAGIVL